MTKGLEQTAKKGEPVFKDERALVVDDKEKWRNVVRNNLEYYGCREIVESADTLDANRRYQQEDFPLAFIDINFDENDPEDTQGMDLISHLREQEYLLSGKVEKIIVAMSSLKDKDIKIISLASGADYFIDKEHFKEEFDEFVERYKRIKI